MPGIDRVTVGQILRICRPRLTSSGRLDLQRGSPTPAEGWTDCLDTGQSDDGHGIESVARVVLGVVLWRILIWNLYRPLTRVIPVVAIVGIGIPMVILAIAIGIHSRVLPKRVHGG